MGWLFPRVKTLRQGHTLPVSLHALRRAVSLAQCQLDRQENFFQWDALEKAGLGGALGRSRKGSGRACSKSSTHAFLPGVTPTGAFS